MSSKLFKDFEAEFDRRRDEQRHGKSERPESGQKRSWREIDRMRDGVGAGPPPKDQKSDDGYADKQAEKALKGKLDSLFRDQEGDALAEAVKGAEDRAALQAAVDALIEAGGGLPPDPDVLEKALDVRRDKTLARVVQSIEGHLPDLSEAFRTVLLLKMRSKARTTFDARVSKAIAALLETYGVED